MTFEQALSYGLEQQIPPRVRDRLPVLAIKSIPQRRRGTTYHIRQLQVRIPLRTLPHIPNVKRQQRPRHNHLDLVRRKESAGARVAAVPERQAVLANTDKLVVRRRLDSARLSSPRHPRLIERLGLLPHAVEAQPVELLGLGEGLPVAAGGVGGDLDHDAGGDVLPVGEGDGLEDLALEGGWYRGLVREQGATKKGT